jgi:hypothetical protein
MNMDNPFQFQHAGATMTACLAEDRIHLVKRFDQSQCHAALTVPDIQTIVKAAVIARLDALRYQRNAKPLGDATIELVDEGQDFLFFDVRDGVIVATRPFQGDIWNGKRVLNTHVEPGDMLRLVSERFGDVTLRYPVKRVLALAEEEAHQ